MYMIITFLLILLIPTFFALIITTNIKDNYRAIVITGTILALILGYMYIPRSLPIDKEILESAFVFCEDWNNPQYYQEQFILIPDDGKAFMNQLKEEKFYPLLDDRKYNFSSSKQFGLLERNYRTHANLYINDRAYSFLSVGNRNYQFKASPNLIKLADKLSRQYGPIALNNDEIEGLKVNLSLKKSYDCTYKANLELETKAQDTLITEVNLYSKYNNGASFSYLLDQSPVTNYTDSFDVPFIRGNPPYTEKIEDCLLIIRGQHLENGHLKPFQKLIDMDEFILQ